MRKLWNVLEKDIERESYTTMEMAVFGVLVPTAFILCLAVAGWLETIF